MSDTIKNYGGVKKVPITTTLLNDVKHSHKVYQQYMEKEEKLMKEKRQKEKENSERQLDLKRKYDMDLKINEIDAQICHIKEKKKYCSRINSWGNGKINKKYQ